MLVWQGAGHQCRSEKGRQCRCGKRGGSDGAGLKGGSAGARLVAQKRRGMAFEQVTDHEPPPSSFYKAASNRKAT